MSAWLSNWLGPVALLVAILSPLVFCLTHTARDIRARRYAFGAWGLVATVSVGILDSWVIMVVLFTHQGTHHGLGL